MVKVEIFVSHLLHLWKAISSWIWDVFWKSVFILLLQISIRKQMCSYMYIYLIVEVTIQKPIFPPLSFVVF